MAQVSQPGLTDSELKDYKALFLTFDHKNEGRITVTDMLNIAQRLGLASHEKDITVLLGNGDSKGNETLDFETFLLLIIRLRAVSEQRRIVEEEMRKAFRVFDHDGNGLIDKEELRKTMKTLGEKLSKSDVKAMIKSADKNGDGLIDYEEFIKMMYGQ